MPTRSKAARARHFANHPGKRSPSLTLSIVMVVLLILLAFPVSKAQTLSTLYTFTGSPDGAFPQGAFLRDAKGNLYGTTSSGGVGSCDPTGCGIVFKLDPAGNETILYRFTGGSDGGNPVGSLTRGSGGIFYGTTADYGPMGHGVVFKLDKTGTQTVLYGFSGGVDGSGPQGSLVRDSAGNLYGTTMQGGDLSCNAPNGCGTVFKLDSNGVLSVLHAFTGGSDGAFPFLVSLVRDGKNNLYGTTMSGGAMWACGYGCGVVFKIDPSGNETVLYSFVGGDGAWPNGNLARDNRGNLWGTTFGGGTYGNGTVFKLDNKGKNTVLYSFTGGADGALPVGGVLRSKQGVLYGNASQGGSNPCLGDGCGTVFQVDKNGNEITLHQFTGAADGLTPWSTVISDNAGNLYGMTVAGWDCCGTVFKITP